MTIVAQMLHSYKDGNVTVAAALDGQTVCIGETANEEHAAEGRIDTLRVVMSLTHAIEMAKAILAAAEPTDEDAWIDAMYARECERRDAEEFMRDCAIEEVVFIRGFMGN